MISKDVAFDEASMLKISPVEKVSSFGEREKKVSKVVVQMEVTLSLGPSSMGSSSTFKKDNETPTEGSSQQQVQ